MKAKLIAVGAGVGPLQIDDFPEKCARSCKGSLHLRPSGTAKATQAELDHIKKKHPAVSAKLRVLADIDIVDPAEPEKAAEKPAAEADTAGDAGSGGDGGSEGAGSDGGGTGAGAGDGAGGGGSEAGGDAGKPGTGKGKGKGKGRQS